MRQPQMHRFILTAAAIQHALGEGHRALRAPASPSVLCAGSQAPGAKSSRGSLLLSRERCSRWLPQPAARAAAFCDDAGGDGGLAQDSRCTPWQSAGEQRRPRELSCCSVRRSGQRQARPRTARLPHVFLSNAARRCAACRSQRPQPPADKGVLPHATRENRVWNASTSFLMFEGRRPLVPLVTRMWTWAKFFGVPIVELFE